LPVCLPASSLASRCHSQARTPEEAPAATTGARVTSHRHRLAAAAATNAVSGHGAERGNVARLRGRHQEHLAARGDQGNDDERRQRDQNVDEAAYDHPANSLQLPRCRLDRWDEALLRKPHCLAAAPAVPLEEAIRFARAAGTEVGQHEVADESALPNEPPSLASRKRRAAKIADSGSHGPPATVFPVTWMGRRLLRL
jgi:hypothetical protein